ncbi:hypothetical protein FXV83_18615 [Bradyrhizobium hipponense]|uniref:Uncharacterized protein n=1 Tax=Bradyrhizobium hipponense TaxID=2605638 RepID=A0A5S4YMW2_9BRAD|nr:hypothetical protein [Bradyrhizobium hipponense]TYO65004.1 hypothetical protein FXV83_18615 [Bradyrhizobium hipponense]
MLATLNSKQIVDEIVKDAIKDNDPHDAVQVSPDIVLASRPNNVAPALAQKIATRPEPKSAPEPKFVLEPKFAPQPKFAPEPKISAISEIRATAPSVDTAVRATAGDLHGRQKRSSVGKWLRGAFVTMLFAGGSAAATIAWEKHGDTAKQMLAEWRPALASLTSTSLTSSTSQATPVAAEQAAAAPVSQTTPDQPADPSATPPAAQDIAAAPDAAQSVQSMTRDLAAMAEQIEQLKANIAQLKAGQEQMAREMAKTPAPKPVAEAKPADPRARVSALPPRPPAAPPVRKPRPVTQAHSPAYAPTPIAPPPPQVVAAPPPAAMTTQAVADDDGPVVRPPMPVH